jgi:cytochrome c556
MKQWHVVMVVAVLLGVALIPKGQTQQPKKDANPIMELKLRHAQKLLEGLALKDFNMMEKNAEELIILSNKAEWRVLKTQEYIIHSNDFRRNADTLAKNAKEKNLDGAALAYVQVTMNCVNCHKHVREVRWVRLDNK